MEAQLFSILITKLKEKSTPENIAVPLALHGSDASCQCIHRTVKLTLNIDANLLYTSFWGEKWETQKQIFTLSLHSFVRLQLILGAAVAQEAKLLSTYQKVVIWSLAPAVNMSKFT